jgi:mannitol-1-phosphate 5-dehydrogenase
MKAVIYGAGNIGRGFIGQIFAESGYEVCFIDVADPVIEALNSQGRYPVRILRNDCSEDIKRREDINYEDKWIEKVRAINGNNEEAAAAAIASADIMATAVGVRALPFIVPVIAAGLKKRFARNTAAFNIIICENLLDANKVLERLIKEHLTNEEQRIFDGAVGLVETSIGRMVPLQTAEMQDGNPLRVCVEAYGYLPVDKAAFRGNAPSLVGIRPFDRFDFFIKRKLFIHNMGHGICAYLGMIRGNNFIYEAVGHGGILFIAQNAMLESALSLSKKYDMPLGDLQHHIRDLLLRFSNKALRDTCARVGSDTVRKLESKDRFIGALHCCIEEGINPVFISAGAAAALYCHLNENRIPQNREAAGAVLREVSGFEGAGAEKVLLFYSLLSQPHQDGDFEKLMEHIIKIALVEGQIPGII